MKKYFSIIVSRYIVVALAACGGEETMKLKMKVETNKSIKVGATAGPYSDMLKKAIIPALEEKGYKREIVEFSDYIQPNIALDNGDIDANFFQHPFI